MKRKEVDYDKLSPMMKQYVDIKEKYEDSILFFRLGDFYEMFFDDAVLASRELELTLTGKTAGLDERVPMCGVPHHAYHSYVDTLINKGYKVAICEQLEDPKSTKGMVKRDVVQIVTRGTRLDERIDSKTNNFLANIYDFGEYYGISYVDITTGEFFAKKIEKNEFDIIREVTKNSFNEVITNSTTDKDLVNKLRTVYNISVTITDNILENDIYSYIYSELDDEIIITTIRHLLSYIIETKKKELVHLQKVEIINNSNYLIFDGNTKRNLELTETIRNKDRLYSLLWLLDKCKTAMGSRLLKYNIENPLTSTKELERRYDLITTLMEEFILRDDLIKELDKVYDLERLVGRISYGNLNAKDLIQLKTSLSALPKIKEILEKLNYDKVIDTFSDLHSIIDKSINVDAPLSLHEGNLIKDGYNEELDELRKVRSGSKSFILELEQEEKERTGIKNLKVGYNKIFGYYIEVSKGQIDKIKEEFGWNRRQTLANCERFTTPLLKEKENIILGAEEKIINLEYKLFMDIREIAKRYITDLQKTSKVISEVDMITSFSIISDENRFVRPTLTNKHELKLIDCRHPVVERVMKDKYISNDIIMDEKTNILLITGPNMAGKSTYMRQCAITVIMAQIGCFVPCKECTMPIFDKIFTRIGASDDLVSGASTFMVEMQEANLAIKEATKNSLILFDELGRGTATYDGMALSSAILEYIHDKIKAKTMFSTHYHELTDLEKNLKHLKNVHVSATYENNELTFLHKVKDGAVDKSYGIHVASLAGLPKVITDKSEEILKIYEKNGGKKEKIIQTSLDFTSKEEEKENIIEEKLDKINLLETTPMEALNFLYKLKKEIKEKR